MSLVNERRQFHATSDDRAAPIFIPPGSSATYPSGMRLGLYGGSFDPIHRGHLLVAQAALEELELDRLVFIPAAQSPFKPESELAPAALRLRLLRLALAGQTRCAVDDLEVRRGGVSYTVDTVRHFAELHPRACFFWLIGADHVAKLPLWRGAAALAELVEFVVIPRPGEEPASLPAPYRLRQLRGWPSRVSASEIRERVRQGMTVGHLVPGIVAGVLETEAIYRA